MQVKSLISNCGENTTGPHLKSSKQKQLLNTQWKIITIMRPTACINDQDMNIGVQSFSLSYMACQRPRSVVNHFCGIAVVGYRK